MFPVNPTYNAPLGAYPQTPITSGAEGIHHAQAALFPGVPLNKADAIEPEEAIGSAQPDVSIRGLNDRADEGRTKPVPMGPGRRRILFERTGGVECPDRAGP